MVQTLIRNPLCHNAQGSIGTNSKIFFGMLISVSGSVFMERLSLGAPRILCALTAAKT